MKTKKFRKVVENDGMRGTLIFSFIAILFIVFISLGLLFATYFDFYLFIIFLCLGGLIFQFIRMVYNYIESRKVYWEEII